MEIPSNISEIFFIMVIILPGYIYLKIFREIALLNKPIPSKEILYQSLTFSLFNIIIASLVFKTTDLNILRHILIQPEKLFIFMILTLTLVIILSFFPRFWLLNHGYTPKDTWTHTIEDVRGIELPWVIINTVKGEEYKGILRAYGVGNEPRDLSILLPIKILRDDSFEIVDEVNMGEEMYFTEKDVSSVLFFGSRIGHEDVSEDESSPG